MQHRHVIYLVIGAIFGMVDFIYLSLLNMIDWEMIFGSSGTGQTLNLIVTFFILNLGSWLVLVIPIAVAETRRSRSRRWPAIAGMAVWSIAIIAYYLTYAIQLAFWGVTGREELLASNRGSAYFWENWMNVLQGDILGGIIEYLAIAVIGGAIMGALTSSIYLRIDQSNTAPNQTRSIA